MIGGTLRIPPLEGALVGMVVVAFADMISCLGGSRGSDPCKLTIGSSVAANASYNGPGAAMGLSGSGPQVSG